MIFNQEHGMKKLNTLDDFLLEEMRDMYHAEGQLLKAIPKVARKATSHQLRQALHRHWEETQTHRSRLEQAFTILGQPAKGAKCEAMEGLIKEGDSLVAAEADPAVMDAAIICAAQKIEHYEIASYGCLCTYARLLGLDEVGQVLAQSLEEEKHADQVLTNLAQNEINTAAMAESMS
jgi:ferritin-like metal-binding protein YciE